MPVLEGISSVPAPGRWLVGSAGSVVAPEARPSGLVDMAAASDGPDVPSGTAAALAFLDALPSALRPAVLSVTASPGHGLSLVVSPPRMASGSVTVVVGDGSQLQAKVTALVTILQTGDLSGVAALDLTVPSRPAAASSVAGLSPTSPAAAGNNSAGSGGKA
jgi:hypothetical protein